MEVSSHPNLCRELLQQQDTAGLAVGLLLPVMYGCGISATKLHLCVCLCACVREIESKQWYVSSKNMLYNGCSAKISAGDAI